MGKLKGTLAGAPTESGLILEKCIQEIMQANKLKHPVEAIQFVLQHLCAVAAAVGVPPMAIVETAMESAMAGLAMDTEDFGEITEKSKLGSVSSGKPPAQTKPH